MKAKKKKKLFIYTFIYLQRHVLRTAKYLDGEFPKIFNGLWLLPIFAKALSRMLDWVLNMFVTYLFYLIFQLFTYNFI